MSWRTQLAEIAGSALVKRLHSLGVLGEDVATPGVKAMMESLQADREAAKAAAMTQHMGPEQLVSPTEVAKIRQDQPTTMMQHVSPHQLPGGYGFNEGFFGKGEGQAVFGPGFYNTIAEGPNPISRYYEGQFGQRQGKFATGEGPLGTDPRIQAEKTLEFQSAIQPVREEGQRVLRAQSENLPPAIANKPAAVGLRSYHLVNDYLMAARAGKSPDEFLLGLKLKGVSDPEILSVASAIEKLPAAFHFQQPKVHRYDVLLTDDINKAVNLDTTIGAQTSDVQSKLRRVENQMPGAQDIYHFVGKTPGFFAGGANLTREGLPASEVEYMKKIFPGRVMSQADWASRPEQAASILYSQDPIGRWSPEMRRQAMKQEGIPGGTFTSGTVLTPGVKWEDAFRNFIGYDASKLLIIRRHGIKGALAAGAITPEVADQLRQHGAPEEGEL